MSNRTNSVGPYKTAPLTLLHSERPKLYTILVFLSAIGLNGAVLYGPTLFVIPSVSFLTHCCTAKLNLFKFRTARKLFLLSQFLEFHGE